MAPLLTATHLARWADERRSQDMLPLLVRRLVVASVNPIRMDFPAGDSINRPGYDGFLQTAAGTAWVPPGQSVWEMGTGRDPAQKAEDDYVTRTADPLTAAPADTIFVFVTPRRWPGKGAWTQEKQAQNVWADVRAYDADDLEQWLDQVPPVAAWARRQTVGAPDGLRDVEEVWELWSLRTTPRLSPELFLAERDAAVARARAWLAGPPSCLRVRADSADEALGFIAGVVENLAEPERERVRSRALLVSTADAWRAVAGQNTPVILLATSPLLGSDAQAVARGHHVLLAYGNEAGGVPVDLALRHLRRAALDAALRQMGIPGDRAGDLADESRGRIAALVDLLGGGTAPPHWAAPAVAPELVPLLLAGSWSRSEGDTAAMSRLTRLDPDTLVQRLSRWVNETDPPVRVVVGTWEWVSRLRAWPHLSRHITGADLAMFRQVVADVLGEQDPRFDLPASERWLNGLRDGGPRYSEQLRRGLAEGLALLATQPLATRPAGDPAEFVSAIVRDLFGPGPDPRRWYSLAALLPVLAEAAPDAFLTAVERDVLGDAAVRAALFEEEGMFGGSRHVNLLWALETLAWSPDYLCRAAVILAGLATQDPGGTLANRPPASLRTIFLPWRPHTMAGATQRLAAIDAINRHFPAVAFGLCLQLMPHGFDSASPTPRPRWRAWNVDRENPVVAEDYWSAVDGAFDRALRWAGEDQGRWSQLLRPIPQVAPERIDQLLARLEGLPLEELADQPGDEIRRAVRRILHQRLTITGLYPQLSEKHITRLEVIYARLQPADLVRRHAWLFDHQPDLLTVTGDDWRAEEDVREAERRRAVRESVQAEGPGVALRLAASAEAPWAVGYYVGQSDLPDADIARLLSECLGGTVACQLSCFQGIVGARFASQGWPWVERIFATEAVRGWPAAGRAQFALALPFETATWDWVEALGEGTATEYWRLTPPHRVADPSRDAPRAIRALLDRARPFTAMRVANMCLRGDRDRSTVGPEPVLAVLRGITAAATGEGRTAEPPEPAGDLGYMCFPPL